MVALRFVHSCKNVSQMFCIARWVHSWPEFSHVLTPFYADLTWCNLLWIVISIQTVYDPIQFPIDRGFPYSLPRLLCYCSVSTAFLLFAKPVLWHMSSRWHRSSDCHCKFFVKGWDDFALSLRRLVLSMLLKSRLSFRLIVEEARWELCLFIA
jgi:hypothetical protein